MKTIQNLRALSLFIVGLAGCAAPSQQTSEVPQSIMAYAYAEIIGPAGGMQPQMAEAELLPSHSLIDP